MHFASEFLQVFSKILHDIFVCVNCLVHYLFDFFQVADRGDHGTSSAFLTARFAYRLRFFQLVEKARHSSFLLIFDCLTECSSKVNSFHWLIIRERLLLNIPNLGHIGDIKTSSRRLIEHTPGALLLLGGKVVANLTGHALDAAWATSCSIFRLRILIWF